MKRLAPALAVAALFVAASSLAQSATLAVADQPPSRTNLVVGQVIEARANPDDPNSINVVMIELWKMTAAGSKADTLTVTISGNAEVNGYLGALETAVAGEPAGTTLAARYRRHNVRILKYLRDSCSTFTVACPAQMSTSTVVP